MVRVGDEVLKNREIFSPFIFPSVRPPQPDWETLGPNREALRPGWKGPKNWLKGLQT